MQRKSFQSAPCSIARALDVLGDWWTPLILRECLYGVHRFDQFQRWLGIGRNILTRRLALLVDEGLLEKRAYQTRPLRHEYHLTEKGYDATSALMALLAFGERWYFADGGVPIRLYDRATDAPVRPQLVDGETGEPLDVRRLYAGPGPAFPAHPEIRRARFTEFLARRGDDALQAPGVDDERASAS
ncbi:MAG: helix-turn-helix domain-containing protein [Acidobacteriota bacterium]